MPACNAILQCTQRLSTAVCGRVYLAVVSEGVVVVVLDVGTRGKTSPSQRESMSGGIGLDPT